MDQLPKALSVSTLHYDVTEMGGVDEKLLVEVLGRVNDILEHIVKEAHEKSIPIVKIQIQHYNILSRDANPNGRRGSADVCFLFSK